MQMTTPEGTVAIIGTGNIGSALAAGGFRKVIGAEESSDQLRAGLLPRGARLVKAFGT
jgi:threonine dehydrogenase-like Zn-dependent dehydrogenase